MSVCRKLPGGTIQKIAGHTILLDANVSEIRQGTFNIQGVAGTDTSVQVTFSDPMPDTDYVVIYEYHSWGGYPVNTEPSPVTCISKTTTGFTARLWCFADMSAPMTIKYTAFKLVKLDGYTELQNKVNNPDSTPTEDSLNLVTSGGVYDAILSASKIFVNSESAWNELDAETKATYQVAILTDKPTVNAVDSTDGSTTVVANKNLVFKGTLEEWEALTTAEKKTYDQALITNDMDTGEVVNAVTDGDMRAVTSNAVYDAMNVVQTGIATNSGANGGTISWIKTGKVVHVSLDAVGTTDTVTRVLTLATGLPKAFIHPNISHPFGNQFASICTGLDINKSIPVSVDDAGKLWLHRSSVEAFEQLSNCYSGFTYITSE